MFKLVSVSPELTSYSHMPVAAAATHQHLHEVNVVSSYLDIPSQLNQPEEALR